MATSVSPLILLLLFVPEALARRIKSSNVQAHNVAEGTEAPQWKKLGTGICVTADRSMPLRMVWSNRKGMKLGTCKRHCVALDACQAINWVASTSQCVAYVAAGTEVHAGTLKDKGWTIIGEIAGSVATGRFDAIVDADATCEGCKEYTCHKYQASRGDSSLQYSYSVLMARPPSRLEAEERSTARSDEHSTTALQDMQEQDLMYWPVDTTAQAAGLWEEEVTRMHCRSHDEIMGVSSQHECQSMCDIGCPGVSVSRDPATAHICLVCKDDTLISGTTIYPLFGFYRKPPYSLGEAGQNGCPPGYKNILTVSACRAAALAQSLVDKTLMDESNTINERPKGCFGSRLSTESAQGHAHFNQNAGVPTNPSLGYKPICAKARPAYFLASVGQSCDDACKEEVGRVNENGDTELKNEEHKHELACDVKSLKFAAGSCQSIIAKLLEEEPVSIIPATAMPHTSKNAGCTSRRTTNPFYGSKQTYLVMNGDPVCNAKAQFRQRVCSCESQAHRDVEDQIESIRREAESKRLAEQEIEYRKAQIGRWKDQWATSGVERSLSWDNSHYSDTDNVLGEDPLDTSQQESLPSDPWQEFKQGVWE